MRASSFCSRPDLVAAAVCACIDQWHVQAHEAGWDKLRLFGVSPDFGTIRGDYCGILVTLSDDVHQVMPD